MALPSPNEARRGVGRVLVIGYGNTLRRDDGVGVRVAELLSEDCRFTGVDVLAVHQLTPELALDIGAASIVVFIDADVEAEPGVIRVQPLASASGSSGTAEPGATSHHFGAVELLALAAALGGGSPSAWYVAVGVVDLGIGEGLSPAVKAALPGTVDRVAELVGSHQHERRGG